MITDCRLVLQFGFVVVLGWFFLTPESKKKISLFVYFSVLKEGRRMNAVQQDSIILTCLDKYKCRACKI